MILLISCFVTEDRAKHLNRTSRFDIFKYTLASYSVLPIEFAYLFIELDKEFVERKKELQEYAEELFGKDKMYLDFKRLTTQLEWRDLFEKIMPLFSNQHKRDLVLYSANDDHIFICPSLTTIKNGMKLLLDQDDEQDYKVDEKEMEQKYELDEKETSSNSITNYNPPFKSLYLSHWPEVCLLSLKKQNVDEKHVDKNFVSFDSTLLDSPQIWQFGGLKHILCDVKWNTPSKKRSEEIYYDKRLWGTCDPSHIGSQHLDKPLQRIYVPLQELCRKYNSYDHVQMSFENCPQLNVPKRFFNKQMKLWFGKVHPKDSPIFKKFKTDVNPEDYVWVSTEKPNEFAPFTQVSEIPFFWWGHIETIEEEKHYENVGRLAFAPHSSSWTAGNNFQVKSSWFSQCFSYQRQ